MSLDMVLLTVLLQHFWILISKKHSSFKCFFNGVNHATTCDGGSVHKLKISGRDFNSKHVILLSELQQHMTNLTDLDLILDGISHDTFEQQ